MILVSNSPHNNKIQTFIDRSNLQVSKCTYFKSAYRDLFQEYEGYKWYFKTLGLKTQLQKLKIAMVPGGKFLQLNAPLFLGTSHKYTKKISENRFLLEKVIKHYTFSWRDERVDCASFHGDLSIGNLVEADGCIRIIDWEHFHPNVAPWGLDLLNIVYESLFFSMNKTGNLSTKDEAAFLDMLFKLAHVFSSRGLGLLTCSDLLNFVSQNPSLWSGRAAKLPVTQFNPVQIRSIRVLEDRVKNWL